MVLASAFLIPMFPTRFLVIASLVVFPKKSFGEIVRELFWDVY
jgi:hypothetical protein